MARRFSPGSAAILGIVAAGLALVHVRLAFFAVMFTVVLSAASLLRGRQRQVVALFAGGIAAAILILPWLVQMRHIAPRAIEPNEARWTSPADVRENLLWVPHTAELLSVATAGLSGIANIGPLTSTERVISFVWWLAIIAIATKRKRTRPLIFAYAILAAWCAIIWLFLNGTHLQFATNTSAAITLFVPISIACGALIAWVIVPFRRVAAAVTVVLCCVIGIATLSHVINPSTIIVSNSDVEALRWMRSSLPPASAIIGHIQPWYGGAFIGVDGAYWSSVLTDRRSLPPPSLYAWSGTGFGEMELFLARWQDEYPFVTHATMAEAKHLGVTHVYFGRGTPPQAPPRVGPVVYARDGITIARLP